MGCPIFESAVIDSRRGQAGYLSQIEIGGDLAVPTVSSTAVSPGGTKPLGTRALICRTPIMSGALPANRISVAPISPQA